MEKNKGKIIILGKNGFVAKSLCNKLKKNNIKFISYSKENLNLQKKSSVIRLKKTISQNDKIVFISSIAPVKNFEMLLKNIKILSNVVQALKNILFNQLIYISSDAVFKDDAKIIKETTEKTPLSLHGNMHLIRENVLKNYFNEKLCILRPTLIYGKKDPHNGYGPNKFLRKITSNQSIDLFGKGEERRDHVHIDDVTGVILLCLKKNFFGDLNIATGKLYSFYNIAKACIKKNKNSKINFIPRVGPMPHNGYRKFNVKKLNSFLKKSKLTDLYNYIEKY